MPELDWLNLSALNRNSRRVARAAVDNVEADVRRIVGVKSGEVLDFGVEPSGTLAGGVELAKVCLADLAEISVRPPASDELSLPMVQVRTDCPVEACMASQYAGWPISVGPFSAIGSGPARVLRGKEELLQQYGLVHAGGPAVAVLETNQLPGDTIVKAVAAECGVTTDQVTLCVAPTASVPGCLQVVARSIEVALHKLHELKFDLTAIRKATGIAPLPPVAKDDLTALGWTNDAILYGGAVDLWVECDDRAITSIGSQIPSCSSDDFGRPFLDLFESYDMDFYKMDKRLFSPAAVTINNVRTGQSFSYGSVRTDVLKASIGWT